MGNDEREWQLSRLAVDVVVHVLVPGQAVLDVGQRRRPRLGVDGRPHDRADPPAVHPRVAIPAAAPRCAQADLAPEVTALETITSDVADHRWVNGIRRALVGLCCSLTLILAATQLSRGYSHFVPI